MSKIVRGTNITQCHVSDESEILRLSQKQRMEWLLPGAGRRKHESISQGVRTFSYTSGVSPRDRYSTVTVVNTVLCTCAFAKRVELRLGAFSTNKLIIKKKGQEEILAGNGYVYGIGCDDGFTSYTYLQTHQIACIHYVQLL